MYDRLDIEVTILVHIDGHTLRFEESGKAAGGRYEGRPVELASMRGSELERSVRGTVDTSIARATQRANTVVARMFPLDDPEPKPVTRQGFAEQVAAQRDDLRDRLAALDYLVEVNKRAESQAANAKDRERGGIVLDPVDPTRAVVPIVWLRALLASERMAGYDILAGSPELRALLREVDEVRKDPAAHEGVDREVPGLWAALTEFTETL